jgi:hypothetical protein
MILEAVRETTELNRRQAEGRNWYSTVKGTSRRVGVTYSLLARMFFI